VDEHPVVVLRAEARERLKPVEYRRLPRCPAAALHRETQAGKAAGIEMAIVGSEHDERLRKFGARIERSQRMAQHRAAADGLVLLRHRRARAAAGAGARNQGIKACSHEWEMLPSQSEARIL
jgi:hypothetical protein